MPSHILATVKKSIKENGAFEFIKKAVKRVCSFVFWRRTLYFYGISGVPQTVLEPRCPLEIRKGSTEDVGLIVDMLKDRDESAVRRRVKFLFDNGGEMFLAFNEGRLAHISWLLYHPGIGESYFNVKLKPDEAYISSVYTPPEFRGRNIYPVVLQHIMRYVAEKNKKRCFITTGPTHVASIKGIEKAGFSFAGKLRMFRLFGKMLNNQWDSSRLSGPE